MIFTQLSVLLALGLAAAGNDIVWKPTCGPEITSSGSPIMCGTLEVPRNYSEATSNQTLQLQLYKLPVANGTKSKHSVLVNFGGPGTNGIDLFVSNATDLQLLLGENHDVVLVNPRGNTGSNLNFTCSQNDTEEAMQAAWTSLNGNASDVARGELWATTQLYANACRASPTAQDGDIIGTAFTARDFMQVAEALDEDGLIYYQGYSYGSVLGMTIASLFPDKIGRMALDGNVNVHDYYQNNYSSYFPHADEVFSKFCSGCVAARDQCSLAHNRSATELESELLNFFDHLKYHPIPIFSPDGNGALIDYSYIITTMYTALQGLLPWPAIADELALLLAGNTTAIPASSIVNPNNDHISGIRCSDTRPRTADQASLDPIIDKTEAISPIFGPLIVSQYYICAQWPFLAEGNFSWPAGNVSIKTREPVLLIGNTYDPTTPLANAEFNSAALEGSVVLQHESVGHTTVFSQGSLCTARAVYAYWRNGTLPQPGTSCKTDVPAFGYDNGWETALRQLASEVGATYH